MRTIWLIITLAIIIIKNNMKVYTKFLIVPVLFVISVFILTSCDKQQGVIEDYTALVEEIETDGENFTEQDWEDFSQRCENVETEMQQYSFDKEQKKEIRKLQGRMAAAIGKHSGTLLKNAAKDAIEQIEAFSEGFMEGINEEDNK